MKNDIEKITQCKIEYENKNKTEVNKIKIYVKEQVNNLNNSYHVMIAVFDEFLSKYGNIDFDEYNDICCILKHIEEIKIDNIKHNSSFYDVIINSSISMVYDIRYKKFDDVFVKIKKIKKYIELLKIEEIKNDEINDFYGYCGRFRFLFKPKMISKDEYILMPCGMKKIDYIDVLWRFKNKTIDIEEIKKLDLLDIKKIIYYKQK